MWAIHSRLLISSERCERIAQVAHQKWVMWAIVSKSLRSLTKNEPMSESLIFEQKTSDSFGKPMSEFPAMSKSYKLGLYAEIQIILGHCKVILAIVWIMTVYNVQHMYIVHSTLVYTNNRNQLMSSESLWPWQLQSNSVTKYCSELYLLLVCRPSWRRWGGWRTTSGRGTPWRTPTQTGSLPPGLAAFIR